MLKSLNKQQHEGHNKCVSCIIYILVPEHKKNAVAPETGFFTNQDKSFETHKCRTNNIHF